MTFRYEAKNNDILDFTKKNVEENNSLKHHDKNGFIEVDKFFTNKEPYTCI